MRKILRQIFWSHGTPLGSLGPGSQGDMHPRASQCQILHIWGLYDHLDLVALQALAEKLKSTPSWCGTLFRRQVIIFNIVMTQKC